MPVEPLFQPPGPAPETENTHQRRGHVQQPQFALFRSFSAVTYTITPKFVMIRAIVTSQPRSLAAIHDILHCIISHLSPDPYVNTWDQEGFSIRQTLGRLAVTHSMFTQPALAALWRSLSDDEVLKQLLCVVGIARKVPQQNGLSGAVLVCLTSLLPPNVTVIL